MVNENKLKSFGFHPGLSFTVGTQGGVTFSSSPSDDEKLLKPIVYVALMDDDSVLKVGVSRNGVWSRWKKTLDVIPGVNENRKLRANEINDGEKLLESASGHKVTVWYKDSLMIKIPYDVTGSEFPAHGAEEIFLDSHFKPKFGQRLSRP